MDDKEKKFIEKMREQKEEAVKSQQLITKSDERVCDKRRIIPIRKG